MGWGTVRIGGTIVVSRSLRLTGDITLRHGWRDRGLDGYPSREMSPSIHRCDTHTRIGKHADTHMRVHKDPGQRSLESLRAKKGWLHWAEMKRLHPLYLKEGGDENKETKLKKRQRVRDCIYLHHLLSDVTSFPEVVSFSFSQFLHICPLSICSLRFFIKA